MKYFIISICAFLIIVSTGKAQKLKTDANVIGDVQCEGEHVPFINITAPGRTPMPMGIPGT